MRVIVSGATGFLGHHTLSALRKNGIDALGTSRSVDDEVKGIKRVEQFSQMPEGDVLIHFSESNNRFQVNEIGEKYLFSIEEQTKVLLKKFSRIIYASSVAVYSENKNYPRTTHEMLLPTDTYSKAKLMVEEMVRGHSGQSIVSRIGNAYGPGMSNLNIISTVINQVAQKLPVIKLVSADPIRDYIWCEDIAEIFTKMIFSPNGGTFNVATGKGTSVREICREVGLILHHDFEIETQKNMPNNQIVMDISETLKAFDWKPTTNLQQGLTNLLMGKNS